MALVPLLVALWRQAHGPTASRRTFVLGLLAGASYFVGTLYWTVDVMTMYGGLSSAAAVPVAGLLVAYLALYPALFALLLGRLIRVAGARALLAAPALWVAAEFARAHVFTGFPWVLLGYSQVRVPSVAQFASVFGVYGVSALVTAVNAVVAYAVAAGWRKAWGAVVAVAALVALVAGWGAWRVSEGRLLSDGAPLTVGIVQGNVPQGQKHDPAYATAIFERYLALSRAAARRGAGLVVWPESATPFPFEEDPAAREAITSLARSAGTWMLVGSDQVERGSPDRYYNAAFVVDSEGRHVGTYRKAHLVPFGEYVPLERFLFFVAPLVESVASFTAGDPGVVVSVHGRPVSVAICYEVVFPHLAALSVDRGSQLLITITNDAWYGWSSAPYQHFEQASMRAIEQGRYLVRAANTGVSGIVDPYGRPTMRSALFEDAMLTGEVRLLAGRTVYGKIGDSFAWASVLVALVACFTGSRRATETRP